MLDIGWTEMVVIAVVALLVIGPKDLPRVLHQVGKYTGKARAMLREFQQGMEDMAREAELDEMRKKLDAARNLDLGKELKDAVDPDNTIGKAFAPPTEPFAPSVPRAPESPAAELPSPDDERAADEALALAPPPENAPDEVIPPAAGTAPETTVEPPPETPRQPAQAS